MSPSGAPAVATCASLPGCRVAQELCKDDKECCSGACRGMPPAEGHGPKRCADVGGCSSSGERCAVAANCCSGQCVVGPEGVARCKGMGCRQPGERCGKSDECCGKAANACRADAAGALRCQGPAAACVSDGHGCALPDQCCSGFCLPDATGALYCRAACAPVGAPCAGTGDCCAGVCGGEPGRTVCIPPAEPAGAVMCLQLGELCDVSAGRCCAGTLCATVTGGGTSCARPVVE
jgi:hypothetical protein